jgi:hypothetical protein
MTAALSAVERAFQLASSGRFQSIEEIKRALDREGHVSAQVSGPVLYRQLRAALVGDLAIERTSRTRRVS